MQPVMKSIEEKYVKDVRVVFHDVWTEAGAPYAKQHGIEAIPTKVFLHWLTESTAPDSQQAVKV